MLKSTILFILFLFFVSNATFGKDSTLQYGLTFQTQVKDGRTSMVLTSDKTLSFADGFSLDFDVNFYEKAYGYIFRIIDDDKRCLDMVVNTGEERINFVLSETKGSIASVQITGDYIKTNKWIKVKVKFDTNYIECSIDGVTKRLSYSIGDMKNIYISFGLCTHKNFHTTDVPPMTVRNVVIKDNNKKIIREWNLLKHHSSEVYDNITSAPATVENGIWEINKHKTIKKEYSRTVSYQSQLATDPVNGRVFIATADSLFIYDLNTRKLECYKTEGGQPLQSGGSQLVYDSVNSQLISYSIEFPQFVIYDFGTRTWSDNLDEELPPIQQHNRLINYGNNQLILFGGYGNHTYKSILARHSLTNNVWKIDTLSGILPRYLSAMTLADSSKLLVLGGYGSNSGKQDEFPKNYNDLTEIDLKTLSCRKIMDFSNMEPFCVFGNSMILSEDKNKLYALAYNNDTYRTNIRIAQIDIGTKSFHILADSIPYRFSDVNSFCDLFYYPGKSLMYITILQSLENNTNNFEVYSIAYPPLSEEDILQKEENSDFWNVFPYLLIFLLIATGVILLPVVKRYNKSREEEHFYSENDIPEDEFHLNDNPPLIELRHSSLILLFGGFQVFDMQGEDITLKFSNTVKQIFLFILLNSTGSKNGVSSSRIDETFWFGMDKESALNNRSVNVHKVKNIVKNIGNITLHNKNNLWYIDIGEDVLCDYFIINELFNQAEKSKTIEVCTVVQIIELASRGIMLPNISNEWADEYKSEYSSRIIDIMLQAASQKEIQQDLKLLIRIANVILLQDNINEDAIRLKCKAYFKLGQKGLSKKYYDKFYKTYYELLNTKPDFEFKDIIKGDF